MNNFALLLNGLFKPLFVRIKLLNFVAHHSPTSEPVSLQLLLYDLGSVKVMIAPTVRYRVLFVQFDLLIESSRQIVKVLIYLAVDIADFSSLKLPGIGHSTILKFPRFS